MSRFVYKREKKKKKKKEKKKEKKKKKNFVRQEKSTQKSGRNRYVGVKER